MHRRRLSEDLQSSPNTRKAPTPQLLDRQKLSPDKPLNQTTKSPNKLINIRPVPTDSSSIASIIQAKVTNLKNKFGELDDMRKKLIESRCESREDTDSKLSTMNHSRVRSGDSSCETYSQEFFKTRSDGLFAQTYSQDKYEIELHNERKSTQKAILEKSLVERESQEKLRHANNQVHNLKAEVENMSERLKISEKRLADSEESRKKQEQLIESQADEMKTLTQQLLSANASVKQLNKQVNTLEQLLKAAKESASSNTVKNLSNIILSKDSPTKNEVTNSQLVNKFMETLQDLQSADQFALDVIQYLEKNNIRKVQQELFGAKSDIVRRMQKTNWSLEEIERYLYDCRSPSTLNRSSLAEYVEINEASDIDKGELMSWIKCQAAVVEDLLLISDMSK